MLSLFSYCAAAIMHPQTPLYMKLKLLLLVVFFVFANNAFAQKGFPFENEIRAFQKQDSISFPKPNGILFIGSSSIRLWDDLEQRFAGQNIIKRGVGGAEMGQLADYYAPYILLPYRARKVFIFAGENDIAAGKSATFVAGKFAKLWQLIHQQSPATEIYFLSIKLSPSRIKFRNEVLQANALIRQYLVSKSKSHYVDLAPAIYKPGTTRSDSALFKPDYLHLNSNGYDKWQAVLEPLVK